MGKVGNTNQKVDEECCAIFAAGAPSMCIHVITSKDVNGRAMISAPMEGLRFTTSDTPTMMATVTKVFITNIQFMDKK